MDLSSISGFFSYIPTDWIVILAFAAIVAADSMRAGTGRACVIVLSLPLAFYLISELPHAIILSGIANQLVMPILKALIFGIVFAAVYFLVHRIVDAYRTGSGAPVQALLAGVAAASVVVVVWLQVPELQSIWNFGPQVQSVFGEAYRFWWIAGSYAALAFVRS